MNIFNQQGDRDIAKTSPRRKGESQAAFFAAKRNSFDGQYERFLARNHDRTPEPTLSFGELIVERDAFSGGRKVAAAE